jgi:hypothetical protein
MTLFERVISRDDSGVPSMLPARGAGRRVVVNSLPAKINRRRRAPPGRTDRVRVFISSNRLPRMGIRL